MNCYEFNEFFQVRFKPTASAPGLSLLDGSSANWATVAPTKGKIVFLTQILVYNHRAA